MEPRRIYGKTEQGAAALNAARGALASSARQLLILIDGRRSVGELEAIFGSDALARLLPQLEAQRYIHHLHDAPVGAAPSGRAIATGTAGAAGATSRPAAAPAAPRPAPPAAPRPRLGVALLALVVLAVSAAIWWMFGQPRVPEAAEAGAPTPPSLAEAPAVAGSTPPATPSPAPAAVPGATSNRETRRLETGAGPRAAAPAATTAPRAPAAIAPLADAPSPPAAPATAAGSSGNNSTATNGGASGGGGGGSGGSAGTNTTAVGTAAAAASGTAEAGSATKAAPAPQPAAAPPATVALASPPGAAANTTPAPPPKASPAVAPPALHARERTLPVLSRQARRAGVNRGTAVVRLHVSARGTVDSVDLLKSDPREVYDATVEQALKRWTYDPPGVPVDTTVELVFSP